MRALEYNQLLRRLRQYTAQDEWAALLIEASSRIAETVGLFVLQDANFILLAGANLSEAAAGFAIPIASAAAFRSVVETKDSVVALRTTGEVSQALCGPNGSRAYLSPILNGPRLVAILFASVNEDVDVNELELIAGLASVVLERRTNAEAFSQIAAVKPATGKHAWAHMSEEQRSIHLRAQRFSRVKVAEMQLAKPAACRSGREQSDLYLYLQPEIDAARDLYRRQFAATPSMVDYLHLELVRAADGNEQKLGAEYPGPLL